MLKQTRLTLSKRLTESSMNASTGHGRITRFRQMTMAGPPATSGALLQKLTSLPPDFERSETDWVKTRRYAFAKSVVDNVVNDVQASIDAASLVFAHSILDDFVSECCRLSMEADPDDWANAINQRKVSIERVRSFSNDQLIKDELQDYGNQISRDALLKRVRILFNKCPPVPFVLKVIPYTFDQGRLESLDKLRQQVVHRPTEKLSFPKIEDDLRFLHWTCDFFAWVVSKKYGLTLENPMMPSRADE